jgi:hypothetical protein
MIPNREDHMASHIARRKFLSRALLRSGRLAAPSASAAARLGAALMFVCRRAAVRDRHPFRKKAFPPASTKQHREQRHDDKEPNKEKDLEERPFLFPLSITTATRPSPARRNRHRGACKQSIVENAAMHGVNSNYAWPDPQPVL